MILTLITVLVTLAEVIGEIVLHAKISSSDYYGNNIFKYLEGLLQFKGCSDEAWNVALDEVSRNFADPVIYDRPPA